jgi:hypothetical protein
MEELMDFDEWYAMQSNKEIDYWAVYDRETGNILGVYPNDAALEFDNKIKIDKELALDIQEGKIAISNCVVDLESDQIEIVEIKSLVKIDDVLHRVVEKSFSEIADPDIVIVKSNGSLIVSINEKYKNGKKTKWDGETVMDFFIADYNDPHNLRGSFSIKISQLIADSATIENIDTESKFSIYTRRLFKKYIIE